MTSTLMTCLLLASIPRVVPEVSFALTDGPMFSLSLLAWCFFVRMVETRSLFAAVGFGIVIGLGMSTKLTGWFLAIPYFVWLLFEVKTGGSVFFSCEVRLRLS